MALDSKIPNGPIADKWTNYKDHINLVNPANKRNLDIIVVGTGLAGASAAATLAEMGYKVKPGDVVQYDGETITTGTKRYVLLNKPKGYITTLDDPRGRKTVMTLVSKACREQIFPVGRMERDTTGLMLFTNDGDMMKKLLHPRYHARKLYHIETNKSVAKEDLEKMTRGLDLDDGRMKAEAASFVEGGGSNEIGVEIRSGKNQVVRRMVEALGYEVIKLDRVVYAGLTKKDLPRGYYRHLTEQEIAFLKMSK